MAEKCWWRDTLQSREKIKKKTSGLSQRRGFFIRPGNDTRTEMREKEETKRRTSTKCRHIKFNAIVIPKINTMNGRQGRTGLPLWLPPKKDERDKMGSNFPKNAEATMCIF